MNSVYDLIASVLASKSANNRSFKQFVKMSGNHAILTRAGARVNVKKTTKNCRICSKSIGVPQRDLSHFREQLILRKARSILSKTDHILYQKFVTLP